MMDVNPLTLGIETSGGVMVRVQPVLFGLVLTTCIAGQTYTAKHWNTNGRFFAEFCSASRLTAESTAAQVANLFYSIGYET